jgi:hypothetical protein
MDLAERLAAPLLAIVGEPWVCTIFGEPLCRYCQQDLRHPRRHPPNCEWLAACRALGVLP